MDELKERAATSASQPERSPLHLKRPPPPPPAAGLVSTRVRRPSGESSVSFETAEAVPNEWPPPWEAGRSPGASLTRAAAAAAALAMTSAQEGDTEQVRQMRWLAKMELGEVDVIDGPL
jgi:hypothetical protein